MGTSLIPIKGISQAQKKSLKSSCNISDIAGLLSNGRTPEQRQSIADKLKIDRRYVDIWVKQAALWNVQGMTEDFAYLLIVAGIRCALDLAKIDVAATRIALKAVSNAHPDHQYDESKLSSLKAAAEALSKSSNENIPVFDENDPEPRHLFAQNGIEVSGSQDVFGNVSKITVTVTLSNGQSYENTTTFPVIQGGISTNTSTGSERPSGRVDHPGMTGGSNNTNTNTNSNKPTGRVDHPGMTGGSNNTSTSTSSTNTGTTIRSSSSTGRRR